jgi:hypothetical protein
VEHRDARVVVETARYRITGLLRLPAEGYRSRLTDYLNGSDRSFVALTDAIIETIGADAPPERREFVAVALGHVVLAAPAESDGGGS